MFMIQVTAEPPEMQGVQFICSSTKITIQMFLKALCIIELLKLAFPSEKNPRFHVACQLPQNTQSAREVTCGMC